MKRYIWAVREVGEMEGFRFYLVCRSLVAAILLVAACSSDNETNGAQSDGCLIDSDCPDALVCGQDGECRAECDEDSDCAEGQVCSQQQVCAEPAEVDEAGDLKDTEQGGTSGVGGSDTAGPGGTGGSAGGASEGAEADNGWEQVGAPDFSGGDGNLLELFVDGETPYVAYMDGANGSKATVMRFDGDAWTPVGEPGFTPDALAMFSSIGLAVSDGVPYLAYADKTNEEKVTVVSFDGDSWEPVGTPGFSEGRAVNVALVVEDGTPYVAYADVAYSYEAVVMTFDGSEWAMLGGAPLLEESNYHASDVSLVVESGTPYVAFQDAGQIQVLQYNDSEAAWVSVGDLGLEPDTARGVALAVDDGVLYVAYEDMAVGDGFEGGLSVMKYAGDAWELLGGRGVSDGAVSYPSVYAVGGIPYVTYKDRAHDFGATVLEHDGDDWVVLGSPGFGSESANHTKVFVSGGYVWVAYCDFGDGTTQPVNVMRHAE